jgi:hypothetical protein
MTDRVRGFTVTLSEDCRIDDIEAIMTAMEMIKGVLHVEPKITTANDHMSEMRVRNEMRAKIYKFIEEEL